MDTNTLPDAIELIRLADPSQSVTVRLRSTEPTLESPGVRYYDAEAVVASGFVNGTVYLGFDSEDLSDWGRLWTPSRRTSRRPTSMSRSRRTGPDPAARPTSDSLPTTPTWSKSMTGPAPRSSSQCRSTCAKISVPLDMREEWIAESRERLAAARAALGVGTQDHYGTRP
ncbi:DUF5959 family protein [Streptomyces sp. C3-3]|uniref:DUF5959 family protein n=1 Tax=Streptomyces sp. C3-3 TaxID=2824901 RepID=UPI0027E4FED2|nr:DUF5959 family protein [Streptomyces sp. C3-3]